MLIERKHTADLIPADYNPRKDLKPGDPEYDKLKRSMEQFGYVEPVIWNKATGRVVGGHQRLKVLMDMGVTEVECVVVEMDEEREKALNIALNKIKGQWDYSRLEQIFSEYELEEAKITGFTGQEIALILAKNDDLEDPSIWQDGDEDEEDDDDPDFLGASCVVTLSFSSRRDAQAWMDEKGLDATAKAGKKPTVIRMD